MNNPKRSGPRDRVLAVLVRMFPGASRAHEHYAGLLLDFWASSLTTPNFIDELESDDDGKFWSFVWEAMLYRHLQAIGRKIRRDRVSKAGQVGPDFAIEDDGGLIWIEAIAPAPEGIPHTFLFSKWGEVRSTPHEAIQLRWTSAVADKAEKFRAYLDRGIVGPRDRLVIAVNACRLSDFWVDDRGISQLPMILEAVFPIGPVAVPISQDGKFGEPVRTPRYFIKKANDAKVPTTAFLDPNYSHVSAVIGCVKSHMLDALGLPTNDLELTLVHNPLATNELPRRVPGAAKEFVADENGPDTFLVHPLDE